MTEIEKTKYQLFIEAMKEAKGLAELRDQLQDPRAPKADDAKKKIDSLAQAYAEKHGLVKSGDKLPENMIPKALDIVQTMVNERVANTFSGNLETIVGNEMPAKGIDHLARTDLIRDNVDEKEKNVLAMYGQWKSYEDFLARYKADGKFESEDEVKKVRGAAAKGAGEALAQSFKKQGYSSNVQDMVRSFVDNLIIGHGYINDNIKKKYAIPGLESLTKEAKKDYEEAAAKSKSAQDISRGVIKKMANGKREEFGKAMAAVYDMHNMYAKAA